MDDEHENSLSCKFFLLSNVEHSRAHNILARKLATFGTVLLKNDEELLPLSSRLKTIAVVGDDAELSPQVTGGGSGAVIPPFVISPLQAISEKAAQM